MSVPRLRELMRGTAVNDFDSRKFLVGGQRYALKNGKAIAGHIASAHPDGKEHSECPACVDIRKRMDEVVR